MRRDYIQIELPEDFYGMSPKKSYKLIKCYLCGKSLNSYHVKSTNVKHNYCYQCFPMGFKLENYNNKLELQRMRYKYQRNWYVKNRKGVKK